MTSNRNYYAQSEPHSSPLDLSEVATEPIEDVEARVAALFADVRPLPATLDTPGPQWRTQGRREGAR